MTISEERKARRAGNKRLQDISRIYHDGLPLDLMDGVLADAGFSKLEPAIYCGREGRSNEKVGDRTWFCMTWHKMESGRYEISAYLS